MTTAITSSVLNAVEQGELKVSKLYITSRLKELRQANNMTQEEFVSIMTVWLEEPISLSLVQKWEQGLKPINPTSLLEIARYFKVQPAELVERR